MAELPLARPEAREPGGSLGARLLGGIARYYSVFVVLAAWEVLAHSGWVNPRLFPSL
jgi:ABC-type nitrate/sulfonate/bicarbonate transport system permease component